MGKLFSKAKENVESMKTMYHTTYVEEKQPKKVDFREVYLKALNVEYERKPFVVETSENPEWLDKYPAKEGTPALRRNNELFTSMSKNKVYELNLIEQKTNDQIRNQLYQKMSNMRMIVPLSQRPPTSQTIIIFDWDDTLLCTSYLNQIEDPQNITEEIKAKLSTLEQAVVKLFNQSLSKGRNMIITNAMKGWIEFSSATWLSLVNEIIKGVTTISARDEYERMYPGNSRQWKIQAFLEIAREFGTDAVTNLVVLGDSMVEMDAAKILAEQYNTAFIKTIKFQDVPTPEQLTKQLELVSDKFDEICSAVKNMTIRLERRASKF